MANEEMPSDGTLRQRQGITAGPCRRRSHAPTSRYQRYHVGACATKAVWSYNKCSDTDRQLLEISAVAVLLVLV